MSSPNRGWGFDTYEFEDYGPQYGIGHRTGGPRPWDPATLHTEQTANSYDVSYQGVESGPRAARLPASKAAGIPPSLYKAFAWIESDYCERLR